MDFFGTKFHTYLSAFRPGYGCQSTLLRIIKDWKQALDDNILKRKRKATLSKMISPSFCYIKKQLAIIKSLSTVICLAYNTKTRPL